MVNDHRWRRFGQIVAAAAVLWYAVVAWLIRVPVVNTGNDDATYLALADALRQLTYRDLYLVGAPFHAQYPPGYPAFVALLDLLPGDQISVLLGANILLVIAGMLAVADVIRQRFSPELGLVVLLVCATNLELALVAGTVMAEPLYLAVSAGALWASVRPAGMRSRAMTGLFAIAAALARSIGVTLVLATGLHWLARRQWRVVGAFGLAAAGSVGLWLVWTVFAPDLPPGYSYIADAAVPSEGYDVGVLELVGQRLRDNFSLYLPRSFPYVLGVPTVTGTPIDNIFWALTLPALLTVGLVSMARTWPLAVWYVVVYGVLLLVWPWVSSRFLIPLIPILVAAIVVGLRALGVRYARRRHRLIIGFSTAVLMLTGAIHQVRAIADFAPCRVEDPVVAPGCFNAEQRAYLAGASYAAVALPADAVVAAAKRATFGYYSGRKVYPLWRLTELSPDTLLHHLADAGVEYVFLGRTLAMEWGEMAHLLQQVCRGLELERAFIPHTYLFRVAPEASSEDSRLACDAISAYIATPPDTSKPAR